MKKSIKHFMKGFGSVMEIMPPPVDVPAPNPDPVDTVAEAWNATGNFLREASVAYEQEEECDGQKKQQKIAGCSDN